MKNKKENQFLIILGATILILIIAIAGIYLNQKAKPQLLQDTQTQKLETQEKSDEIFSIEKDLKETDFSGLDKELEDIETEISGI